MLNFQIVGFAIIAGVAAVGADYYQQTLKADLSPGDLSVGAYLATVTGRFDAVQEDRAAAAEEKERQLRVKTGARIYLPEAPEGWTRRDWAGGDNSPITDPPRELTDVEREMLEGDKLLANMAAASEQRQEEARNAQIWVYERGDEVVSVRARFTQMPTGNTLTGNAMTMIVGNMSAMTRVEGWGVIRGVAFGIPNSFLDDDRERPYRKLTAVIGFGDEVALEVRTNAGDAAVREILTRIDYDGLNGLLPRPLAHVGSGAPDVAPEHEIELATRMIEIREDLVQRRTQAASDWLHAASSPEDAMTLALRQAGYNIDGTMAAADADLAQALQALEADSLANPADEASLDGDGTDVALQEAASEEPAEVADRSRIVVSQPLSLEKIQKLESLTGAEKSMALAGLQVSARKFEQKQGLPEGSCTFSLANYRVECDSAQRDARAESSGGVFGLLKSMTGSSEPEKPAKPTRLKLSGGSACLDNAVGGLCKN